MHSLAWKSGVLLVARVSSVPPAAVKARSFKILISVAFRNWKCYYLPCFKESDSWSMIFDTGGSRKIAVTGLESWKVGEFFSRKERKGSQRLETRNSKLETRN